MIYLGISGWNFDHLGKYFHSPKNRLAQYSTQSRLVELNQTFFETPDISSIKSWKIDTPQDFNFIARMLKSVTYNTDFLRNEELIDHIEILKKLDRKLTMLLLHFNIKFHKSKDNLDFIDELLKSCSDHFNGHILLDMKHMSWRVHDSELKAKLLKYSSSLVISDKNIITHSMRDKDVLYLRLAGDNILIPKDKFGLQILDKNRDIKYWAKYIKSLQRRHKLIFVIIDNHFSGDSMRDIIFLSKELKNLKVKHFGFHPE